MTKLIQYDHIKERCRAYNVNGTHWGKGGMINFIVGLGEFSVDERETYPYYYVSGTTEFGFSISTILSSRKKFARQFYNKFTTAARGANRPIGPQSVLITEAFRDKDYHIGEDEFISIPEVMECIERIRFQVKTVEKSLKEERGSRRIKELKQRFKTDVDSFIRRYNLSREEIHSVIHDCMKEMEVEDVMKT